MTIKETVLACNEAIGAHNYPDVSILAIWVVIDTHYGLYYDYIEKYPSRQLLKSYQTKWNKLLKDFNHSIFKGLPEDLGCELVNVVFEDYIEHMHNHIVRLRLAIMKQVKTEDVEVKKRFASAYICQELTILAQTLFRRAFSVAVPKSRMRSNGKSGDATSLTLERLQYNIRLWYLEYLKGLKIPVPLRTKEIENEEAELCRETVRWIVKINKALQDKNEV